jgi:hypothetical protein
MKTASIALIVVGLLSLIMSVAWPSIMPTPEPLSEEEMVHYEEAVGDTHGSGAELTGEAKEIAEKFQQSVESNERMRSGGATALRFGGIIAALIGAGLFFWQARSEE